MADLLSLLPFIPKGAVVNILMPRLMPQQKKNLTARGEGELVKKPRREGRRRGASRKKVKTSAFLSQFLPKKSVEKKLRWRNFRLLEGKQKDVFFLSFWIFKEVFFFCETPISPPPPPAKKLVVTTSSPSSSFSLFRHRKAAEGISASFLSSFQKRREGSFIKSVEDWVIRGRENHFSFLLLLPNPFYAKSFVCPQRRENRRRGGGSNNYSSSSSSNRAHDYGNPRRKGGKILTSLRKEEKKEGGGEGKRGNANFSWSD